MLIISERKFLQKDSEISVTSTPIKMFYEQQELHCFKLIAAPKQVKSYYSMKQGSLRYEATYFYNFMSHLNFQITFSFYYDLFKHMSMPKACPLTVSLASTVYIKLAIKLPLCSLGYIRQSDTSFVYSFSYQILIYSFPYLLLNLISF